MSTRHGPEESRELEYSITLPISPIREFDDCLQKCYKVYILSGTEAVVQRIHQAVAKWNKKIPLLDFPVTLAIGTSYWYPERAEPVEAVLYDADRRMYMDKQAHQTDGSEKT